jgi:hypothetical protein
LLRRSNEKGERGEKCGTQVITAYKIVFGESEGKGPFFKPRHNNWEKMNFKAVGSESVA